APHHSHSKTNVNAPRQLTLRSLSRLIPLLKPKILRQSPRTLRRIIPGRLNTILADLLKTLTQRLLSQLSHTLLILTHTIRPPTQMLIDSPVRTVKPARQLRRLHEMFIHLSLVAQKLITNLLSLLLRTALPERRTLPRTANQGADNDANNQCDNRCQNQVC